MQGVVGPYTKTINSPITSDPLSLKARNSDLYQLAIFQLLLPLPCVYTYTGFYS